MLAVPARRATSAVRPPSGAAMLGARREPNSFESAPPMFAEATDGAKTTSACAALRRVSCSVWLLSGMRL